jgi:glutathione S-transferase
LEKSIQADVLQSIIYKFNHAIYTGNNMDKIKLCYFDFNGGRGEPIRIAMSIAGIDFEDKRMSFPEFSKMRGSTPLNAFPTLEINGEVYTQSNAMNRYFGKQAGLYPDDPWEAFKCDEVMEAIEDVYHCMVRTFGLEGEGLKRARGTLSNTLNIYLKLLGKRLVAAGDVFFADTKLTVADLKVYVLVKSLTSGSLDHIPVDLTQQVAPNLLKHMARIDEEPSVVAYYQKLNAE